MFLEAGVPAELRASSVNGTEIRRAPPWPLKSTSPSGVGSSASARMTASSATESSPRNRAKSARRKTTSTSTVSPCAKMSFEAIRTVQDASPPRIWGP